MTPLSLVWIFLSAVATASGVDVVTVSEPPVIDGVIQESVWDLAEPVTEFLPLRDYYHRHTKSIFWELEQVGQGPSNLTLLHEPRTLSPAP